MTNKRALKPWTDDELGMVADSDLTVREIALQLGRTKASVEGMRSRIKAGWEPKHASWTDEEDRIIHETWHLPVPEVAASLPGRTYNSITGRRKILRADHGLVAQRNYDPRKIGSRPLIAKTCPGCGLLLQAMWFHQERSGRWRTKCTRCHSEWDKRKPLTKERSARFKNNRSRILNMIRDKASRTGMPWTEVDFETLSDPDMTITEKALKLHRSWEATSKACARNGYPSKRGLGDPEHDQWKIDNPNAKEFAA